MKGNFKSTTEERRKAALKGMRRRKKRLATKSWYCVPCAVEVYDRRCKHCGKLEHDTN